MTEERIEDAVIVEETTGVEAPAVEPITKEQELQEEIVLYRKELDQIASGTLDTMNPINAIEGFKKTDAKLIKTVEKVYENISEKASQVSKDVLETAIQRRNFADKLLAYMEFISRDVEYSSIVAEEIWKVVEEANYINKASGKLDWNTDMIKDKIKDGSLTIEEVKETTVNLDAQIKEIQEVRIHASEVIEFITEPTVADELSRVVSNGKIFKMKVDAFCKWMTKKSPSAKNRKGRDNFDYINYRVKSEVTEYFTKEENASVLEVILASMGVDKENKEKVELAINHFVLLMSLGMAKFIQGTLASRSVLSKQELLMMPYSASYSELYTEYVRLFFEELR